MEAKRKCVCVRAWHGGMGEREKNCCKNKWSVDSFVGIHGCDPNFTISPLFPSLSLCLSLSLSLSLFLSLIQWKCWNVRTFKFTPIQIETKTASELKIFFRSRSATNYFVFI